MEFKPRTFRLEGEMQRQNLMALIPHLPIYADEPLEIVIRTEKKRRGLDQNAAMWAGPLRDIAEQAWISGQKYSADVWHEWLKREYLPEADDPEIAELAKDGYRKWDYLPNGERVLVGSTTQLTRKGMTRYLQQVEAFGAGLGVEFRYVERAA